MHHPQLLSQFVQAQGPRRLVRLLSSASSEPELVASALQIVRSLADVKGPRRALVGEAVLPSLLRNIRPSMPPSAVEPAAAAIAVLAKHEPPLCKGLVDANGVPALVKLLERGGGSLAAHSAASALASVASDDEVGGEAKRLAREAYAVEALLPLLDGVLSGDGSQASTVCRRGERARRALPRLLGERGGAALARRARLRRRPAALARVAAAAQGGRVRRHRRRRGERSRVDRRAAAPRSGRPPRQARAGRHEAGRRVGAGGALAAHAARRRCPRVGGRRRDGRGGRRRAAARRAALRGQQAARAAAASSWGGSRARRRRRASRSSAWGRCRRSSR